MNCHSNLLLDLVVLGGEDPNDLERGASLIRYSWADKSQSASAVLVFIRLIVYLKASLFSTCNWHSNKAICQYGT